MKRNRCKPISVSLIHLIGSGSYTNPMGSTRLYLLFLNRQTYILYIYPTRPRDIWGVKRDWELHLLMMLLARGWARREGYSTQHTFYKSAPQIRPKVFIGRGGDVSSPSILGFWGDSSSHWCRRMILNGWIIYKKLGKTLATNGLSNSIIPPAVVRPVYNLLPRLSVGRQSIKCKQDFKVPRTLDVFLSLAAPFWPGLYLFRTSFPLGHSICWLSIGKDILPFTPNYSNF